MKTRNFVEMSDWILITFEYKDDEAYEDSAKRFLDLINHLLDDKEIDITKANDIDEFIDIVMDDINEDDCIIHNLY